MEKKQIFFLIVILQKNPNYGYLSINLHKLGNSSAQLSINSRIQKDPKISIHVIKWITCICLATKYEESGYVGTVLQPHGLCIRSVTPQTDL